MRLAVFAALVALAPLASSQDCEITPFQNPFSQNVYNLVEWQGHYYDAGWLHLRRRPTEGGSWTNFGGGIGGGAGGFFTDPIVEYDGKLAIGGLYSFAGGQFVGNVATWDGSNFAPLDTGFNGEVSSLVVWNGQLVAGGEFTADAFGQVALDHVAIFDTEVGEWMPLGAGLGNLPAGYSSAIWDMTVHEGELYATGRFQSSGATQLNGVARFDTATSSWQPLGTGIPGMQSGNVGTAIASFGGLLWVSGWFGSIGGVSASFMGTWDGNQWSAGPPGSTRHCLRLTVYQGELWGAGPFPFTISGSEHDIAKTDGGAWQAIGSVNSNWPSAMSLNEDESGLLIGGDFSTFNGTFSGNSFLYDCSEECELALAYGPSTGANVGTLSSDEAPLAGTQMTFDLEGLGGASGGFLLFSTGSFSAPILGGTLLVDPTSSIGDAILVPLTGGAGSLPITLPSSIAGVNFFAQAAAPDDGQSGGVAFTNGLDVTVCP